MKRKNYQRKTANYRLKRKLERYDETFTIPKSHLPKKKEVVAWAGSENKEDAPLKIYTDGDLTYTPPQLRENFTYNRRNKALLDPIELEFYNDTMKEAKDRSIVNIGIGDHYMNLETQLGMVQVKLSSKISYTKEGVEYREPVSFVKF